MNTIDESVVNPAKSASRAHQQVVVPKRKPHWRALSPALPVNRIRRAAIIPWSRSGMTPKKGIAAIFGKWPGDETDEQIEAALREIS